MANKTTAYGSPDSLKPAIWGPSIIPVFHPPPPPPLPHPPLSSIDALAKPYHYCCHLNSITDTPAKGDVIKYFIDFFFSFLVVVIH